MNPTADMTIRSAWFQTFLVTVGCLILAGCTMKPAMLTIDGLEKPLASGEILDTGGNKSLSFDQLINALDNVRVIYVGERHTSKDHHRKQLDVIKALVEKGRRVSVGMEMFDHTYQRHLDRWAAGELEWENFLKQVHWYANWKFDDALYKEILTYIQKRNLPLVGLNIPFHLPAKIAVGGLETLSRQERKLLPDQIDLSDSEHRAYVEKIYNMHKIRGRDDFDNFYAAQCAWEDGMAQAIADNLKESTMVVIAGNGHIVRKFGIPKRAYARTGIPYRTIYQVSPESEASLFDGDFIWVSPTSSSKRKMPH
jgi:uncharacterized iron-regulated protein